jgi:hypothetical protein
MWTTLALADTANINVIFLGVGACSPTVVKVSSGLMIACLTNIERFSVCFVNLATIFIRRRGANVIALFNNVFTAR